MSLLFSDDLAVPDSIPFHSLPTYSSQEPEFQEAESDRSDNRETEDGRLSGMENNTSFFPFTFHSLIQLCTFHTELWGANLKMEKVPDNGRAT